MEETESEQNLNIIRMIVGEEVEKNGKYQIETSIAFFSKMDFQVFLGQLALSST